MLIIYVLLFVMLYLIVFFIVCCCLFGFIKEVVDKVGINGKSGYVDYIEIIEKCCFIVKDEYDDFIEFLM